MYDFIIIIIDSCFLFQLIANNSNVDIELLFSIHCNDEISANNFSFYGCWFFFLIVVNIISFTFCIEHTCHICLSVCRSVRQNFTYDPPIDRLKSIRTNFSHSICKNIFRHQYYFQSVSLYLCVSMCCTNTTAHYAAS